MREEICSESLLPKLLATFVPIYGLKLKVQVSKKLIRVIRQIEQIILFDRRKDGKDAKKKAIASGKVKDLLDRD